METVTAIHAYGEYQPVAKSVARCFWPEPRELDALARTRDDHVQELRLHAIEAAHRFQCQKGFCLPAERRYTYKALWNHARNWRRENQRHHVVAVPLDDGNGEALGSYRIESQLEARQVVQSLLAHLSPQERALLPRLMESGGCLQKAFDPQIDGNQRTLRKRVARLRQKAKKALGE